MPILCCFLPTHCCMQAGEWRVAFALNWVIAAVFGAFGVTAIVFSIMKIVQNSYTFGVFAKCYQCSAAAGAAHAG